MRNGDYTTPSAPFGYCLRDGALVIKPDEAQIVRRIFSEYVAGQGVTSIAQGLTREGVKRKGGGSEWYTTTILYILKNESYTGDSLYQKTYTPNTMPFTKRYNNGELEQYLFQNEHPAIIDRETYQRAQALIEHRKAERLRHANQPPSYTPLRIFCSRCGFAYRRKKVSGKYYWVCRKRDNSKKLCDSPSFLESNLHEAFRRLYNKLRLNRNAVLKPMLDRLYSYKRIKRINNPQLAEIDRYANSTGRIMC